MAVAGGDGRLAGTEPATSVAGQALAVVAWATGTPGAYLRLALRRVWPVDVEETVSCGPACGLLLGLGCQYCGQEEP